MVMLTEVNKSVSTCARGVGGEHAWERPEARGALSSVSLAALWHRLYRVFSFSLILSTPVGV